MNSHKEKNLARVFISYSRRSKVDCLFAEFLKAFLSNQGHQPFIDTSMRVGTEWLKEIDSQLRHSDYVVVLLSQESSESEMVQAELRRAYEYRKIQGNPRPLPVRMGFNDLLPYSIDAFLEQAQTIYWSSPADNQKIALELISVIEGKKQLDINTTLSILPSSYTEDGGTSPLHGEIPRPLSEFDPRLLEYLDTPGGALRISDQFYVTREADQRLRRELKKPGSTTTIRAPRQSGKSSLLIRSIHHARQNAKNIHIDLQITDKQYFYSPETFLNYLSLKIANKTGVDTKEAEHILGSSLGPQDKLTNLLGEIILPSSGKILLTLDEADKLLDTNYYSDFFALIRSWHNLRALDPLWENLNIVMVISTEPYLLIADSNQSPFNVGLRLDLEDFTFEQVSGLNKNHGFPVKENEINDFLSLFGGHPYLTRKALYVLVTEKWNWDKLKKHSLDVNGPFSDHLRHNQWILQSDPKLKTVLDQVIRLNKSDDEGSLLRLSKSGLIKGRGENYQCRCGLYYEYFKGKTV